ncbi:MAG: type I-E CRISPR-associated endoribonuclease Cas2e [Roseateles sp.]|uniref:type I-E CRISPR-associated endoribonuclease Cas2e n=1 Tax=Roseateles sp. TaxID=1971397 RepID=UPI0039EBF630
MTLTVLITRDVEDRYRGFLASALLELSPGVYASPHLGAKAREQIWKVVSDWHAQLQRGSLTLLYPDRQADGGLHVRQLGTSPRHPVRLEGVLLMSKG